MSHISKPILVFILVVVCLRLEAGNEFITFSPDRVLPSEDQPLAQVERAWNEIEEEKKERIEKLLFVDLGLSSTGNIEAIGRYSLIESSEFGEVNDIVFHFIQKDIFGSRLVWSCLINSNSMKYQLLYHAESPSQLGEIKPVSEHHIQSVVTIPLRLRLHSM